MNFRAKTAIPDSVVVDVPQYPPVPVSDLFKKIKFRILRSAYKLSVKEVHYSSFEMQKRRRRKPIAV